MVTNSPTPYPEINLLLADLQARIQAVLGEQVVGIYVHGSLALGGFDPRRSDIDFLVVTAERLAEPALAALQVMHQELSHSSSEWARRIEGSYIPQASLRRYDPANACHPALRYDTSFAIDHHAVDWIIQRFILREYGLALVGPSLSTLIDPISPGELRRAAYGILQEWWLPQLQDHSRLLSTEYQAYAVLTMCRALYTLAHGSVAAKPQAAGWARAQLSHQRELIDLALAWGHGIEWDHLGEVLELIRYTIERGRSWLSEAQAGVLET